MEVHAPTSAADMQVFDDYLQQLGEDTAAYVRTVCQTIVLTVPKAVIHCQVGQSAASSLYRPAITNSYDSFCETPLTLHAHVLGRLGSMH